MLKGFSCSAPRVTLAEAQKEIERLPDRERRRALDDLHGAGAIRRKRGPGDEGKCNGNDDSSVTMTLRASDCDGASSSTSTTNHEGIVETQEFVTSALEELRREVDAIPATQRATYNRALLACPDHVNDPGFRMMFLRCDMYDPEAAARRLVKYWDAKLYVWGEKLVFKPRITANDFDEEDKTALMGGGSVVLPDCDLSGRAVYVVDKTKNDHRITHRMSNLKLIWYMHHVAIEDAEVQKRGLVYVAGNPLRKSSLQEQDRKLDSKALDFVRTALPVRVVGIHHYASSRLIAYVVPILLALFGSSAWRARYRLYNGDAEEFVKELDKYGIEKSILPRDMGGDSTFDYSSWLDERRRQGF